MYDIRYIVHDFLIGFTTYSSKSNTQQSVSIYYIVDEYIDQYDIKMIKCQQICYRKNSFLYKTLYSYEKKLQASSIRNYFKSKLPVDIKTKQELNRAIIEWIFTVKRVWD